MYGINVCFCVDVVVSIRVTIGKVLEESLARSENQFPERLTASTPGIDDRTEGFVSKRLRYLTVIVPRT